MVYERIKDIYTVFRRASNFPRNDVEFFLEDIGAFRKRNSVEFDSVYMNVFSRGFGFMIKNGDYERDFIQQNLTLLASYSENKDIYMIKSFGLITQPISGEVNSFGNESILNARAEFLGIKRKIEDFGIDVKVVNAPDFLKGK